MRLQFTALGRFLVTRSSGVAALRRGLSLYLALGIFSAVIFGHSGLDAATVVRMVEQTPAARLLALLAWTIATLPAVRGILTTEANDVLRSLPISRWSILPWLGGLMAVAELPWFALWARGGGVASGVGATLVALALHACLIARVRGLGDASWLAVLCASWLAGAPLARIGVGTVTFAFALSRAWQRAPERRASRVAGRIIGPPALALATAYALAVARGHMAALARALFIVSIGMIWACVAVRNDEASRGQIERIMRVVLAVWIPSCVFAAATTTGPILRTEATAEWVFAVCGTTMKQQRTATLGLLSAAGGTVGLLWGSLLGVALGLPLPERFAMAAALALTGAALSAITEVCLRWTIRDNGRDGGRIVLVLLTLIGLPEVALWFSL